MADLIDRDALKCYVNGLSTNCLNEWSTLGVLSAIENQDTVDAVPVVRCKDCKFRKIDLSAKEYNLCMLHEIPRHIFLTFYCAYGEKKDDNK